MLLNLLSQISWQFQLVGLYQERDIKLMTNYNG
ncbi:hypothetical protein PSM36_2024 [Proteiniphilum saccharofermentans]|uniref:Uncharacterized protein n=1 Tax=Proteiniphilum saccharofermentans TaxID=1642647 RepID=A0A1R3SZA9_9BACT|nr:hypothetical protein PSM36_2024 [Proteiniphilum saccharofermentans]